MGDTLRMTQTATSGQRETLMTRTQGPCSFFRTKKAAGCSAVRSGSGRGGIGCDVFALRGQGWSSQRRHRAATVPLQRPAWRWEAAPRRGSAGFPVTSTVQTRTLSGYWPAFRAAKGRTSVFTKSPGAILIPAAYRGSCNFHAWPGPLGSPQRSPSSEGRERFPAAG